MFYDFLLHLPKWVVETRSFEFRRSVSRTDFFGGQKRRRKNQKLSLGWLVVHILEKEMKKG
jgi:hypothetical protein